MLVLYVLLDEVHILLGLLAGEGEVGAGGFSADGLVGIGDGGIHQDDVAPLLADVGAER